MVVDRGIGLNSTLWRVWLKIGYVFLCRNDGAFYFGFAQSQSPDRGFSYCARKVD